MIYVATKELIKEMTANQAELASGANAGALNDHTANNGSTNSIVKGDRSDLLRLPALYKGNYR